MTINGSPRKNGFSAKMLQCFTEYSVGHGVSVRNYNAFESSFAPCTDCRACRKFEGCVNHDMDKFYRDFENAIAIVITTPIYNMTFPAPLKTIIDRMQRYYNARFYLNKRPPIAKYRPVYLFAAAGAPNEKGDVVIKQLKRIFTVTNCELAGTYIFENTDNISIDDFPTSLFHDYIKMEIAGIFENID